MEQQRVRWTPLERQTVASAMAQALMATPGMSRLEAVRQAQGALVDSRRRDIRAWSVVEPVLGELLESELAKLQSGAGAQLVTGGGTVGGSAEAAATAVAEGDGTSERSENNAVVLDLEVPLAAEQAAKGSAQGVVSRVEALLAQVGYASEERKALLESILSRQNELNIGPSLDSAIDTAEGTSPEMLAQSGEADVASGAAEEEDALLSAAPALAQGASTEDSASAPASERPSSEPVAAHVPLLHPPVQEAVPPAGPQLPASVDAASLAEAVAFVINTELLPELKAFVRAELSALRSTLLQSLAARRSSEAERAGASRTLAAVPPQPSVEPAPLEVAQADSTHASGRQAVAAQEAAGAEPAAETGAEAPARQPLSPGHCKIAVLGHAPHASAQLEVALAIVGDVKTWRPVQGPQQLAMVLKGAQIAVVPDDDAALEGLGELSIPVFRHEGNPERLLERLREFLAMDHPSAVF